MLNIYLHTYIFDVLWACCRDRTPLPFGSMVEAHPDDWDVAYGDLMPGGPLHFTGAIVYPQPFRNLSNTYIYIYTYMYKHMYMLIFLRDTRAIVAAA